MNNKSRLTPLLIALSLIAGILIGTFYANHFSGNRLSIINTGSNKINYLLQMVDNQYVDTVDMNSLVEQAMPKILSELDPHSSYIPANDAEEASEDLKGSFSGIGISFTMPNDSVCVSMPIKGGPAERVGIMAGDRIVKADTINLVGIDQMDVKKYLKGPKGTTVRLEVVRRGRLNPLYFTVVRGDIPVKSIDAAYLIDKQTGYIRVKSFGEQTYAEFMIALAELSVEGMESLIIDLRGNRGGYMDVPIELANEFLSKGQLIVYKEGRKSPREDFRCDGHGSFQRMPLVVLIDEGSASSSEIFAGAIQDNDRGMVVGRRSFGKGLVQQPMEFKDGSVVRLTVARYYTPSGRCIQKPYEPGHGEDYENELIERYERGEYFIEDSIRQTGDAYKTRIGRTVYGGGGITPDIFVPEDTSYVTSYFREAVYEGHIRQFAFDYCDENRSELNKCGTLEELKAYLAKQGLLEKFAAYAEKQGLRRRNLMLYRSRQLFERAIYGNIIYDIRDAEDYIRFLNEDDKTVKRALELTANGETYPKK
ncbi:MAG: S41 family peptidase [Bacteroidaceae bacterium]|nr:S41 family peptidase [Bacteroidaceae bacterium]